MKRSSSSAAQLWGSEVGKGASNRSSRSSSQAAPAMSIAPSPTLLGLSDVLDGTADWLTGQNGSLSGLLLGSGAKQTSTSDSAREVKLAECLKELAAFQRGRFEELREEDDPMQPKDLNSTSFSGAGSTQPLSSEVDSAFKKGSDVVAVKNINPRRREVKEVKQQKPWSFSTKSPVRPLKKDGSFGKGERMVRLPKKSPLVVAKSRQFIIHSNPLAVGRRLSAASSKRRETLEKSPTMCKRMSNSPAFKPKSAERKKNEAANVAGRKPSLESTPTSKGGRGESKAPRITDRQKEILKRVMNSPAVGKKRVLNREKANGGTPRVDLSFAGRRARRLSQVLRNENEILLQNQQYVKELEQLRQQFACKEQKAERAQSAGMLLRQVCANQAEELKAYKGAFPTLFKEMSDLREDYHKQETELHSELSTKLSLQTEVSKLRERVDSLTNDVKQARTLNTVLAERVQQYEKTQCTSCRLHTNQKPLKKEVSPMSAKKAGHSLQTPPRPRSDSTLGRRSSPRPSVASMKEMENVYQQENLKKPSLKGTGEATQNSKRDPDQHDSALQARCENTSLGLVSAGGPPVDALKNRISSLLLTASQALENQHRAM